MTTPEDSGLTPEDLAILVQCVADIVYAKLVDRFEKQPIKTPIWINASQCSKALGINDSTLLRHRVKGHLTEGVDYKRSPSLKKLVYDVDQCRETLHLTGA
jgi:hypothetical protein